MVKRNYWLKRIEAAWRKHNVVWLAGKWRAERFDPAALQSFRRLYPKGRNFIVAQDVERPFKRRFSELETTFCPLDSLIELLEEE